MTDGSQTPPLRAVRIEAKCPVCGKLADAALRPFCSKRCTNIDLGRWLKEGYRIPTHEGPSEDDEESSDQGRGPTGQES